MRILVDFDDTISLNGKPNCQLIAWLRQRQIEGNVVVLYTSRTGKRLNEAVTFCGKHGLPLHGVIGGKPVADLYIDDKAVPFR